MELKDFDYNLPKELIAQKPVYPRDHSRLLVLDKSNPPPSRLRRTDGKISHHHFYEIGSFLKDGDVLVLNNTKVIPARLIGKKFETGGKVEVFLIQPKSKDLKEYRWVREWTVIGSPKLNQGQKINFNRNCYKPKFSIKTC